MWHLIKTFQVNKSVDQSSQHVNMNATTATNTSFDSSKVSVCDMCSNYEAQLVKEQKRTSELEAKVHAAEKAAERHKEELLKEIGFRKDMEEKWNEKKEEHKQQVISFYSHSYKRLKFEKWSYSWILKVKGWWFCSVGISFFAIIFYYNFLCFRLLNWREQQNAPSRIWKSWDNTSIKVVLRWRWI